MHHIKKYFTAFCLATSLQILPSSEDFIQKYTTIEEVCDVYSSIFNILSNDKMPFTRKISAESSSSESRTSSGPTVRSVRNNKNHDLTNASPEEYEYKFDAKWSDQWIRQERNDAFLKLEKEISKLQRIALKLSLS